jgi:heptosyltransferase I
LNISNKRILILKQSSLGDVIHTLPVAHAIKRCNPECTIGWVVQKPFKGLLECDPAVDNVFPIEIPSTSDPHAGKFAFFKAVMATIKYLRRLRKQFLYNPYDVVLDLHASIRSAMIGLTSPGGYRVGFKDAREFNPLFQHHKIIVPETAVHAVDKNLLFCEYLKCPAVQKDFTLYTDPNDEENVANFLKRSGWHADKAIIYINPCARWVSKYWSVQNWSILCDKLIHETGCLIVMAGSRQDKTYISSIAELMTEKPVIAAGSLSLPEIAALLHKSSVYVGLDSGPMHMAALAGVPVVALFGPTHPERVKPYGVKHKVIQNPEVDCLGCRKRNCSDMSCLNGISADVVYQEVIEFLPDDMK